MASEHDADAASGRVTSHTYRVEVKVPRVARPSETVWRTLVPPAPWGQVADAIEHLRESLLLAFVGDVEVVDRYLADHVRVEEYEITTVKKGVIATPVGP